MPSRRQVLKSAAVLSASPLAGKFAYAGDASIASQVRVIVDSRYREALEFGHRARDLGSSFSEMAGDVTPVWQRELLGHWRSGTGVVVAGVTERASLFVLERLAWDYGLRVMFEAEHTPGVDGQFRHAVKRTGDAALQRHLHDAGPGWTLALADALLTGTGAVSQNLQPTDAAMAASLHEPVKLHSWVIAPKGAV